MADHLRKETQDLLEQGNALFGKKILVDSLWQEIANNFYPERANFTSPHIFGEDFANHLYTSYPLLVRRDLGDVFTQSRPQSEEWFLMGLTDEDREDRDSKIWMQHKTKIMRRVMYDQNSRFVRSMKEGDHDWVTFGQCALSIELNRLRNGLLYRNWHLRDMTWTESYSGFVDQVWRRWKPEIRQLKSYFGEDKLHPSVLAERDQNKTISCMHISVPALFYQALKQNGLPWVSLYIDVDNQHVIEEMPIAYKHYIIPRWTTVSDSQYAYSPAVIAGLPDARLYQDMTRVMLESGEKALNPPLIAIDQLAGADIDIQAGGVTTISAEYDERLGAALRPLNIDRSGMPLGIEITDRIQAMLAQAMYLDKINLPRGRGEMTATEASIRFQEYIRTILPLFEPKESEMEAQVLELTYDILWRHGALGSIRDMPPAMQGSSFQFKFISPLSRALEQKKTEIFFDVSAILQTAAEVDPLVTANLDLNRATRDAIEGTGADERWLNEEDQVEEAQKQAKDQQAAEAAIDTTQKAKDLLTDAA